MTVESDARFAAAEAIRDWIHEQPFSLCNMGSDTCPDWPMAFAIRDVALAAIDMPRREAEVRAAMLREVDEFLNALPDSGDERIALHLIELRELLAAHFNPEAEL